MTRERIARYRITETLGEGGMGVVYAAVDDRLGRSVALKVIRRETASDDIVRERFWREARLAASVNHPNICQLYEIGEADGELFIAMERLDGESLAKILGRGPLPLADAIATGVQLLDAIAALHRRGIVHRDLKPSNVFVTPHGIKLLDFGLARPVVDANAVTRADLTTPGAIVGTPRYMAPEQITAGAFDSRTDLFAVGALLYEMLAGRPAFDAPSLAGLIDQILRADVQVLGGSPSVTALDRIIHRALAKAPDERYPDAAAMASDLRSVARAGDAEPGHARAVTRVMVLPFRLLRPDPDIEFLAFGLADAITNSISSIESLVVRSTLTAAQYASAAPDVARIAMDANVDIVIAGTLLRAHNQVRVSTQLVDAETGAVRWSDISQFAIDDIFALQDALSRRIVESLAVPLSARERRALSRDVPASAKAYEFYLRGNQLSADAKSWELARDLYLQALQEDPHYAPAWARLGRQCRVLAKYGVDATENLARAESALNRALDLNPDLSIADHFYSQLEMESGRSQEAMVRLLRRAATRTSDPDLFAALVSACRYCGLLQPSSAAHERARRLDPHVRTSVHYTYMAAGDYARAAQEGGSEIDLTFWSLYWSGERERAIAAAEADLRKATGMKLELIIRATIGELRGIPEPGALRRAIDDLIDSGFHDPEGLFMWGTLLSRYGESDRALELVVHAVDRGFLPIAMLTRHPALEPLRGRSEFDAVVEKARAGQRAAYDAFVAAGGERLLGAGENASDPTVRVS